MIKRLFFLFFIIQFSICGAQNTLKFEKTIKKNLDYAVDKYSRMISMGFDSMQYPNTIEKNGLLDFVAPDNWVSGFYPGILWYLYSYTHEEEFRSEANIKTKFLEDQKTNDGSHDIGFILYCSYGNKYRFARDETSKDILIEAAETLISRYDKDVGCIKSWDWGHWMWDYPVIIDNLMNLELLYWAGEVSGNKKYTEIANSHASTTIKNHFRNDYSTYHVVDYCPKTGKVQKQQTFQGYADSSTWARGEAWALYGYTMAYRFTGNKKYLKQATNVANYIIDNLKGDYVPVWDFSLNEQEGEPKDASAAAIMASAFIELSSYVPEKDSILFLETGTNMVLELSSPEYIAELDSENRFILKNSTIYKKVDKYDLPVIYADYYYVEAMLRILYPQEFNNKQALLNNSIGIVANKKK